MRKHCREKCSLSFHCVCRSAFYYEADYEQHFTEADGDDFVAYAKQHLSCSSDVMSDVLAQGLYILHVLRLFTVFPREQVLVLRMEDMVADQRAAFSSIVDFFGAGKLTDKIWEAFAALPRENAGKKRAPGRGEDEVMAQLRELYAPYNKRLAELLGDNRYYVYGSAEWSEYTALLRAAAKKQ